MCTYWMCAYSCVHDRLGFTWMVILRISYKRLVNISTVMHYAELHDLEAMILIIMKVDVLEFHISYT